MQISHHAQQRINQRVISRRVMDFALSHGRIEGAKGIFRAFVENVRPRYRLVFCPLDLAKLPKFRVDSCARFGLSLRPGSTN